MKKNIALVIFVIMALVMFGCSSGEKNYVENNPDSSRDNSNAWLAGLITRVPVLFGVGGGPLATGQVKSKGGMRGSSLYWINTITGSATVIGDIGYAVEGIAYDAITNKLYGITSGLYAPASYKESGRSQLIEIDMATGAGSLIGTITSGDYYSNPTFNALGTLYAVNNDDHRLCTINLTTAEADCFGNAAEAYVYKSSDDDDDFGPLQLKERGLAFNNIDVLYLIVPDKVKGEYKEPSHGARVYTYDADHMGFDYQRTILGLPYDMAPNGDFDPLTGLYWGLDSLYYYGDDDDDSISLLDDDDDFAMKHLLMIDADGGNLVNTIPTLGNLHAITFGYLDASTLIKMGLNSLIDFLCHKDDPT
jgi:hypothetical protein